MTKFLLSALLLCALASGAFWYWTSTPQYSLKQLADAVHNHDLPSFQTYFDVNAVSNNAITDLTKAQISDEGGRGLLSRFLGMAFISFLEPEAAQALAKGINDYVARKPIDPNNPSALPPPPKQDTASIEVTSDDSSVSINVTDNAPPDSNRRGGFFARAVRGLVNKVKRAIKTPSIREVLQEMGVKKENYRGLTSIEGTGQICHVGLKFQPADKPELIVELELEKTENHWRVVRFSNLVIIAQTVSRI